MGFIAVPPALADRPFTTAEANAAGISRDVLRGPRFRRLFRGTYVRHDLKLTTTVWLHAARLVLPKDAVISHLTALAMYGLDFGVGWPLHFSTATSTHTRQQGITVHRRQGHFHANRIRGLPVTGPERTIVDIATTVGLVQLIQAAEWLIHTKQTTAQILSERATEWHLNGVQRVRRAVPLVRHGPESLMETLLRLMIVFARLSEPACNAVIRSSTGRFLARGDLVYAEFLVLVEYDGWQHERDPRQRQHDRERRELLEGAGWRVIIVTSADLADKRAVVRRIHTALKARGYEGREPLFNAMWDKFFA
jgi:very-short-patch-repair endonuclease